MRLHPEETEAGPWRHVDDAELTGILASLLGEARGVLLVDGRSGSGKSTFAERAARLLDGAVVHSDDLSWNHDAVAWDELALTHVVEPWRRGETVDFRPPAWAIHGRDGSVSVPAGWSRRSAPERVLVLEGVGAGRASLATHADAVVWVQSDRMEARERGIRRDIELGRTPEAAERFWDDWMGAEEPFLAADRPWERAALVVATLEAERAPGRTTVAPGPAIRG
ncbi:MAG TPA: hypothetical protein VLI66_10550 [Terrabacter sp.]|nr:hypothetical protein [Terrabacter sp.]